MIDFINAKFTKCGDGILRIWQSLYQQKKIRVQANLARVKKLISALLILIPRKGRVFSDLVLISFNEKLNTILHKLIKFGMSLTKNT